MNAQTDSKSLMGGRVLLIDYLLRSNVINLLEGADFCDFIIQHISSVPRLFFLRVGHWRR